MSRKNCTKRWWPRKSTASTRRPLLADPFAFDPFGNCNATVYTSGGRDEWTGWPRLYDGYGMLVYTTGLNMGLHVSQPLQYKGQAGCYTDGFSGLLYCHHRWYDPVIARWLTRDPAGLEGGVNVYEYCGSNPLRFVDPSGLEDDWLDIVLKNCSNFFAGWGDCLTFGGTGAVRRAMGVDGVVDYNSGMYQGGQATGFVHQLAFGAAGGAKALSGRLAARNLPNWQASEAWLAKELGGVSQKLYKVNGTIRRVDQFAKGFAHEAKYGFQYLTVAVKQQIRSDATLVASGELKGATWHFFRSAKTGKIGASQPLLDELKKNGIKIVIHK